MRLLELPVGREGRIEGLELGGDMKKRLLDLGFVPGTRIRVLRRSGGKHLTAVWVRGTTICLRKDEAASIRLEESSERSGTDERIG